jgi:hypothetical protein
MQIGGSRGPYAWLPGRVVGQAAVAAVMLVALLSQHLYWGPNHAHAQSAAIQIPYAPACRDCRIVSDTVVIIGGALYGDSIRVGARLARDSRGFYYAAATVARHRGGKRMVGRRRDATDRDRGDAIPVFTADGEVVVERCS